MNHIFLIAICMLSITDCSLQKDVQSISYHSMSRAYRETVSFNSDSVTIHIESGRGNFQAENYYQLIDSKEWNSLVNKLSSIDWSTFDSLKSPTMKRTYDGAKHATINIAYQGEVYTHSFDDQNPHEQLTPLMKAISSARNNLIENKKP